MCSPPSVSMPALFCSPLRGYIYEYLYKRKMAGVIQKEYLFKVFLLPEGNIRLLKLGANLFKNKDATVMYIIMVLLGTTFSTRLPRCWWRDHDENLWTCSDSPRGWEEDKEEEEKEEEVIEGSRD